MLCIIVSTKFAKCFKMSIASRSKPYIKKFNYQLDNENLKNNLCCSGYPQGFSNDRINITPLCFGVN